MRVVIEIPDDVYKSCRNLKNSPYYDNSFRDTAIFAIGNGTVLPQNPTNGDMIKTVFPDIALYEKNHDAIEISFNGVWGNAPYERGE